MAIISLSSIPPRFQGIQDTLETLLRQRRKVDEIRLYIPKCYRRFPDWDGVPPKVDPRIRVLRTDEDFGPATKILPAADSLRGTQTPILFCDDDRLYPEDWSDGLLDAHDPRKRRCIAVCGRHVGQIVPGARDPGITRRAVLGRPFDLRYRLHRMGQQLAERRLRPAAEKPPRPKVRRAGRTEILLGYGGAVVRPDFFDAAVFDVPEGIGMVDDIWLSGHLARLGVEIWLPRGLRVCTRSRNDPTAPLRGAVFDGHARDALNRKAVRHFQDTYGLWLPETPGGAMPDTGCGRALPRRIGLSRDR